MTTKTSLPIEPPGLATLAGMIAPLVTFLVGQWAWGLVPGMFASTAVAVAMALLRYSRGQAVGWLSLAVIAYVLARGAAGALTGSHQVFFGVSVGASMATALLVGASAFTSTPLAAYAMPALMRGRLRAGTVSHATYRRVCAQVTVTWALAELAVSGWEAWHLQHADAVEFVGARALVGWPVMAAVVFACAFYARFRIEWLQGPQRDNSSAILLTPSTMSSSASA